MIEYFADLDNEGNLESFLSDLVDMLNAKDEAVITLRIPTMQWVDILFDIIESDEQYQIAKGEEPFLDIVFACENMTNDTTINPVIDAFDGADPMEELADLMKQLRDALEQGDDDEED